MKAMILAAGLGKRMQPLTNTIPKPLLEVGGKYLIEFHLEKLAAAGIRDVVINTHWLAEQIPQALGSGEKWGLNIHYSHEPELLETAGGIRQALEYLIDDSLLDNSLADDSSEIFLLINGDVYFEWELSAWLDKSKTALKEYQAFLALVPNPPHHLNGDFTCSKASHLLGLNQNSSQDTYTYAGLGVFRASFFADLDPGYRALGPLLKQAMANELIVGQVENAYWLDVGTPERLEELIARS